MNKSHVDYSFHLENATTKWINWVKLLTFRGDLLAFDPKIARKKR